MGVIMQRAQTLEHDPLVRITDEILKHDRFNFAMLRYVEKVIAWRRQLGVFNRVGTSLGLHVSHYVIYFHFANRAGLVEHGATFSRILEICEQRQQCGARAVRTVLSVLRVMGYLRQERSPSDGRVQVYAPTDKLTREVVEGFALSLSVLDDLEPGGNYEDRVRKDAAFLTDIVTHSGGAVVVDGIEIVEPFPDINAIITKAGGFPTSISIAAAQIRNIDCPSARSIAKEFRISQSQVRSVIDELEKRALVVRSENGAIVDASPLVYLHRMLVARELALHVKHTLKLETFPV